MTEKIKEIVAILLKEKEENGENAAAIKFDEIVEERKIPLWGRIAIQQEFKKYLKL